jgi:hypothetical protein
VVCNLNKVKVSFLSLTWTNRQPRGTAVPVKAWKVGACREVERGRGM